MEDVDFSDAFCRFIQTHLSTVDAAELLISAYRNRDLAVPAGKEADAFRAAGLLDEHGRYRPANEDLARHVEKLVKAYDERPVTLVRIIYALRDSRIRSFADAFKLRKD